MLSAAYEVMIDVGPGRTTLSEVARRAGVSRMTVYRRYDQLSTLVSAVLTAELTTVLAQAYESAPDESDRQRFASTVTATVRAIAEHPLMVRIIDIDPDVITPLLVARRGSTQRAAEAVMRQLLESCTDGSVQVRSTELARASSSPARPRSSTPIPWRAPKVTTAPAGSNSPT